MLGQSITRNSLLLALFAVCTTALIAGTYLLTKDDIAEQKRLAEEKALLEIVPRTRHDNSMLDDTLPVGPGMRDWASVKKSGFISHARTARWSQRLFLSSRRMATPERSS